MNITQSLLRTHQKAILCKCIGVKIEDFAGALLFCAVACLNLIEAEMKEPWVIIITAVEPPLEGHLTGSHLTQPNLVIITSHFLPFF